MIARLRWESSRMGTFGHETRWRLMAGRAALATIEYGFDGKFWLAIGCDVAEFDSVDSAKIEAEQILSVTDTGSYELGRRDMQAECVAWLRERADECLVDDDPDRADIVANQELGWAADELEQHGAAKEGNGA
jgi:hypothetical protein